MNKVIVLKSQSINQSINRNTQTSKTLISQDSFWCCLGFVFFLKTTIQANTNMPLTWTLFIFRDIDLKTTFDIERKSDEVHYTYLDTIGRPVIVAKKTNLVEQHIADFEVSLSILLLCIGSVLVVFFCDVILHSDKIFNIVKKKSSGPVRQSMKLMETCKWYSEYDLSGISLAKCQMK